MDEVIEMYWALNEHASALQADQHVTRRKCKFVALWKSTGRGHQDAVDYAAIWRIGLKFLLTGLLNINK